MLIINTTADLQAAEPSAERSAFLQSLLDDYVTFDNAEYPEGYDHELKPGDAGYVAPVQRQEWNSGAAAAWGFASREAIESALA